MQLREVAEILALLGGLGLLLYGLHVMASGLGASAGSRLSTAFAAVGRRPWLGVLVGTGFTALIQSSSATTVSVVGLVDSGVLRFRDAIGLILGANIGTTATAQITALHLTGLGLPLVGVGAVLNLAGLKKIGSWASSMVGLGLLFLGIGTLEEALLPLSQATWFAHLLMYVSKNRWFGLFTGAVLTAFVQSSSATIAVLQSLSATGLVDVTGAIPIMLGADIGTTTTALLASANAGTAARQAAMMHLVFNVVGAVVFIWLVGPLGRFAAWTSDLPARQIANAHLAYNVACTLLLYPWIGGLARLVEKLLPG